MKTLTGPQLRAARAILGISAQELASRSRIGVATIRRGELQVGQVSMTPANAERLIETLEAAGVVFIEPNGAGAGVRLREP